MRIARRFGPLAAAGAVLAVMAGIIGLQAAGNSADSFAVDLDTAGNTASTLGARDECIEATAGTSIVIDVTATNVPAATEMLGFVFTLNYNPAVFTVSAHDLAGLLSTSPGYSELDASDPLPDTDGLYNAATTDTAAGAGTSGSGYLQRLTLDIAAGAAAGGYPLTLTDAAHVENQQNTAYAPDEIFGARVAVGVTCASLPSPTVAPSNKQGDVDCSGGVNSVDALKVLRHVALLTVAQTEPCDDIGTGSPLQGDVDCSGGVNSVDALKVLRHVALLSVTQNEPCADIGT